MLDYMIMFPSLSYHICELCLICIKVFLSKNFQVCFRLILFHELSHANDLISMQVRTLSR